MPALDGKIAIVTGGGRGIGRAIAAALAGAGAAVLITAARKTDELQASAAAIASSGGRVLAEPADVTREEDCRRVVARALGELGGLHILVNNAGRGYRFVLEANRHLPEPERLKFWNTPPEIWRLILDTNITGPFLMARAALPAMLAQRWGRIVNIGATSNTMRKAGNAPYGISKAAVEPATIIWAQDLAGSGVTVNTLLPGGATATGMATELSGSGGKRLLDPAIMGPPAVWLATEEADSVTGARLDAKRWDASLPGRQAFERAATAAVIADER
jgi:NAD(P)-dependent dehydrogenase (short-subunit alcohol dehydrogenase family)